MTGGEETEGDQDVARTNTIAIALTIPAEITEDRVVLAKTEAHATAEDLAETHITMTHKVTIKWLKHC